MTTTNSKRGSALRSLSVYEKGNEKGSVFLWVYGTLKTGGPLNAYYMERAEYICQLSLRGLRLLHLAGVGYPIAVRDGRYKALGEVWKLSKSDFEKVSSMERGAGYSVARITTALGPLHFYIMELSKRKAAAYIKGGRFVPVRRGNWSRKNFEPQRPSGLWI